MLSVRGDRRNRCLALHPEDGPRQLRSTCSETIVDPRTVIPDASSMGPTSRTPAAYSTSGAGPVWPSVRRFRTSLRRLVDDSAANADELVNVTECWYLDDGGTVIAECTATDTEVLAFFVGRSADRRSSPVEELPYSFVTGDFWNGAGVRHYSSLTRYAKADQVAINYAESRWISDIVMTPGHAVHPARPTRSRTTEDWATARHGTHSQGEGRCREDQALLATRTKSARFMAFSPVPPAEHDR